MGKPTFHPDRFAHLPRGGSSVYVIERSDGAIKVGHSHNPRQRLIGLAAEFKRHGLHMLRFSSVSGSRALERVLIERLKGLGTQHPHRREYFQGVTYDAVLHGYLTTGSVPTESA